MSYEDWGRVEFSLAPGLVPRDDPAQYVVEVNGAVWTESERQTRAGHEDVETEVGRVEMLLVLATHAGNDGVPLMDVCDAHSGLLLNVFETLFRPNDEPRPELDIEPSYSDLLYVDSLELNRPQQGLAVRVLETAISVFCAGGLIVADQRVVELSTEQWRTLGFKKIAGSNLVFRDNCCINPYVQPAD